MKARRSKRSQAALKGWKTRKAQARKRSQSARKGWATRRKKIAHRPVKFFTPVFNLCYASDRQDFFDTVREDYHAEQIKLAQKKSLASSRLRVEIDVIGSPKDGRRKIKTKRKSTKFIGVRTFSNLTKLQEFLLLKLGYNNKEIDWSGQGMCQFKKTAKLYVKAPNKRYRDRTVKRYKLES